jgi:hypothetical protein
MRQGLCLDTLIKVISAKVDFLGSGHFAENCSMTMFSRDHGIALLK